MKCPVCQAVMAEQDFGGVKIDVCQDGCKGMWFDWFELSKLDEKNEGFGDVLRKALEYPRVNDENRGLIDCPKCSMPMQVHKYQSAKEVNIDECYKCAGFFLDSGELKAIRDNHMSQEEQEAYNEKLLSEIPDYARAKEDLGKKTARSEAIRRFTKFIRASYYATGQ